MQDSTGQSERSSAPGTPSPSQPGVGQPGVAHPGAPASGCEISIVIPCLNEADTIKSCVEQACRAIRELQIAGEVVVADNGSTDGSRDIAAAAGARVVPVEERGYGNALMAGIRAAHGRYVLMGDADGSYDFGELGRFLEPLRRGCDLVQGCRMPSGGGTVMPGAMPFLHRWLGNPMFSVLARLFFKAPIHDVNCGMRAFSREHFVKLDQRCTGMEFAVEMVLKSSLGGAKFAEVPITLHKDGRINTRRHLRTFRDGWRTLRFYLVCTPLWLFFAPGLLLSLLGFAALLLGLFGADIGGVRFDVNTLLIGTMATLIGYQAMVFALSAKQFGISEGLLPPDPVFERRASVLSLERGLIIGSVLILFGLFGVLHVVHLWRVVHFGSLDPAWTSRITVSSLLSISLGVQTILASFFLAILRMQRRTAPSMTLSEEGRY